MPRKLYEGYQYEDPDSKYTYPHSSILINKLGVTNEQEASEKEYELAGMRLLELEISPIPVHSVKDILKIHGYLFQDLYSWAGKYREVNISKQGNAFMAMQAFNTAETYMNSLLRDYHRLTLETR